MFSASYASCARASAALAAMILAGCLAEPGIAPAPAGSGETVVFDVRMGVGGVSAPTGSQTAKGAKGAAITLGALVLTFTSDAGDEVRDTLTAMTTPALNPDGASGQTLQKQYSLAAQRSWKLVAETRDALDSLIHRDSVAIPPLFAGDTASVNLSLSPRFSMYRATFLSFPDSIRAATPQQPRLALCVNRIVLRVDSVPVRDSVSQTPCFPAATPHLLAYDYVEIGTRDIALEAYGPLNGWDASNPLYRGSSILTVGASVDTARALNLDWVGPATGTGVLEAELGRVGRVTVNGHLPGTYVP